MKNLSKVNLKKKKRRKRRRNRTYRKTQSSQTFYPSGNWLCQVGALILRLKNPGTAEFYHDETFRITGLKNEFSENYIRIQS